MPQSALAGDSALLWGRVYRLCRLQVCRLLVPLCLGEEQVGYFPSGPADTSIAASPFLSSSLLPQDLYGGLLGSIAAPSHSDLMFRKPQAGVLPDQAFLALSV